MLISVTEKDAENYEMFRNFLKIFCQFTTPYYRAGGFMINQPPLNEGWCRGRQVGRDEQDGFD